tara:strand:+ start:320 stop:769 length:450 start_codon:yes stop_codon:yes gene_type:complete
MENNNWFTDFKSLQEEIDSPSKDSTNPHFGNKYASFDSCLTTIKPALHKNNFVLVQSNNRDDLGDYTETKFLHETGKELTTKVYLVLDKQNMQGMGSAITYAKRYGILTLAGIEPEVKDDDDANKSSVGNSTPSYQSKPKQPSKSKYQL